MSDNFVVYWKHYLVDNILSAIEDEVLSIVSYDWNKDKEFHIMTIEFPRTKLELEEEHYQKMEGKQ